MIKFLFLHMCVVIQLSRDGMGKYQESDSAGQLN